MSKIFGSVPPEKQRQSDALSAMADAFLSGRPAPEEAVAAFPNKPVGLVARFFAEKAQLDPDPAPAPKSGDVGLKYESPAAMISESPDRLSVSRAEQIQALRTLINDASTLLARLEQRYLLKEDV